MFRRICVAVLVTVLALLAVSCSRDPEKAKRKYFESGQKYMQQGKHREAEIQFKNAVRIDPKFADAQLALAKADVKLSQWADAFHALQQVISVDPNRLDAHLSLSELYLAAGQHDKAEEEAIAVLERDPRNAAGLQLLGSSYVARSQNEKAHETFSKLVEVTPNEGSAYGNLGLVEIAMKRFADAERNLKKAVELNAKLPAAYMNLANYYRMQKQLPEAEHVLQQGLGQTPEDARLHLALAEVLSDQNRPNDAEAVLQKLVQSKPSDPDISVVVGDFYSNHGNNDKALAEFKRGSAAVASNLVLKDRVVEMLLVSNQIDQARPLNAEVLSKAPKDPVARVQHARILIADQKLDDAISDLQRQAADTPESAPVHFALGLAHWQKAEVDQARTEFQNALKFDQKMVVAWRALANLYLSGGEAKIAKNYALHVVELVPGSSQDRLLLGTTLLANQELPAARQQFSLAQQLSPNDPSPHAHLARTFAIEKKSAQAEAEYETALKLRPQSPEVMAAYLDFLTASGQLPKALDHAKQYAATYPNEASAHYLLGSVLAKAKSYAEAKAEAERIIQIDPNFVNGYLLLGKMNQQLNETDAALARYEQAIKMQPNIPPLQTLVGNLYLDKGDLPKARYYYEQALAKNPNFAIAASNLAWIYAMQGENLDVALGLAQKAKQQMPQLDTITDTLGWVQYKRGSYTAAIPLFKECVQKAPEQAMYRYHLGMSLVAVGDKTKGKSELQAAIRMKLSPKDDEAARRALAQLN